MFESLKGFAFANILLFLAVLVILPPVGVILFGLFFVPIIIMVGFGWLFAGVRSVFTKGTS
jgi:hypothetical protein